MAMRSLRKRAIPLAAAAEEPVEAKKIDPTPPPPAVPSEPEVTVSMAITSDVLSQVTMPSATNSEASSQGLVELSTEMQAELPTDLEGVEMNDALKSAYLAYGDVFLQKKPRTRKELTIEDKVKVIERSWTGMSERQIAREFNISKTAVHTALMKEQQILEEYIGGGGARKRKARSTYALVDDEVWMWYQNLVLKNLPVSGAMIQRRARQIAAVHGVKNFKGSNGWLDSFKRRHNIGPVDLQHPHSSISAYMQPLLNSLAEEGRLDQTGELSDLDLPPEDPNNAEVKSRSKSADSLINMPLVPKKELVPEDGDGKQSSEAVELPDAVLLATLANKRRQGRPKKKTVQRPAGTTGNCIQQPHLLGLPLLANLVSYKQFLDQQEVDQDSPAAKTADDADQKDVKPAIKSGGKSPKSSTSTTTTPRGKRTIAKKAMGALMQKLQASKKTAQELSVAQELAAMATRHTPQQDQLSAQLMAAVRQFCMDTIQYTRQLQITGQISVKYDDSTITTVFNDNFAKDGPTGKVQDNGKQMKNPEVASAAPAVKVEKGGKRPAAAGKSPASKRSRRSTSSRASRQSRDDGPTSPPVRPKRGAKKKEIGAAKKGGNVVEDVKSVAPSPGKQFPVDTKVQGEEKGSMSPVRCLVGEDSMLSEEEITEIVTIELPAEDIPEAVDLPPAVSEQSQGVVTVVPCVEEPEKPTVVPSIVEPVKLPEVAPSSEETAKIPAPSPAVAVTTAATSQPSAAPATASKGKGSFASGKGLRLRAAGAAGSAGSGSRLSLVVPAIPASGFMHSMSINTPGTPLSPLHVPPLTPSVLMSPGCGGTNLQDILLAILSQRGSGEGDLQTPQPHLLQTPSLAPTSISLNMDKKITADTGLDSKSVNNAGMRLPTVPSKMKEERPNEVHMPPVSPPPLSVSQPLTSTSPSVMLPEPSASLQSVMRLLQSDSSVPSTVKNEPPLPHVNPKQDLQDELSIVRNTAVLQAAGLTSQIPSTQSTHSSPLSGKPAAHSLSSYQSPNYTFNTVPAPTGHLTKSIVVGNTPATSSEASMATFQMKYTTKPILSCDTQATDGQYLHQSGKSMAQLENLQKITASSHMIPSLAIPQKVISHTTSLGQLPHNIISSVDTVVHSQTLNVPHQTAPIPHPSLTPGSYQSLQPQISQAGASQDTLSLPSANPLLRQIKSDAVPSTNSQILFSLNMEPYAPKPVAQIPSKSLHAPTMLAQLSTPVHGSVHSKPPLPSQVPAGHQPASSSVITLPIQSIQVRPGDPSHVQPQKLVLAPPTHTVSVAPPTQLPPQLIKSAGGQFTFVQIPGAGPNQPPTILQLPAGANLASLLSAATVAQVPSGLHPTSSQVPPTTSLSSSSFPSIQIPAGLVYPGARQQTAPLSPGSEAIMSGRIDSIVEQLHKEDAASQPPLRPAIPAPSSLLPPAGIRRAPSPHPHPQHILGQTATNLPRAPSPHPQQMMSQPPTNLPQVLTTAPQTSPHHNLPSPHHGYLPTTVHSEPTKGLELQHIYQSTQHHPPTALRNSPSPHHTRHAVAESNKIYSELSSEQSALTGRLPTGQLTSHPIPQVALRNSPSPHHVMQSVTYSSDVRSLSNLMPSHPTSLPQSVHPLPPQPQRNPSPHHLPLPSLTVEPNRSLPSSSYPTTYQTMSSTALTEALQSHTTAQHVPSVRSVLPEPKTLTIDSSHPPTQTLHISYAAASAPSSNTVPPTVSSYSVVPLATHSLPPQAPRPSLAPSQPVRSALLSYTAPAPSKAAKVSYGTQTVSRSSAVMQGNVPPQVTSS